MPSQSLAEFLDEHGTESIWKIAQPVMNAFELWRGLGRRVGHWFVGDSQWRSRGATVSRLVIKSMFSCREKKYC